MLDWPSEDIGLAGLLVWRTQRLLQAEQPVQWSSIGSGDIRVLPEFVGLYIAVDGAVESRGDSEAPIEQLTVKKKNVGKARHISE